MDKRYILDKYYYKEDIQELLYEYNLPISGNKDDLIERVLTQANITVKEILEFCDKDELRYICDDNDLKLSGSKSDLINRILPLIKQKIPLQQVPQPTPSPISHKPQPSPQYTPPPIQYHPSPSPPQQSITQQTPKTIKPQHLPQGDIFSNVNRAIESWIPLKRHSREEGYQVDLQATLNNTGFQVRMEAGESQADIVVQNTIPIELKKNPSQGAYDRLVGQLLRHYRAYGYAIAVICDVKRLEKYQDFLDSINMFFPAEKIKIIKK